MSHISHSSKMKFPISLILQRHYIWWSRPFQAVNPKVMLSYIIVEFRPTPEKVKTTSPSLAYCRGMCDAGFMYGLV